ncbi:MAG: fluoride efflux transporter CrcB [Vicinamibacterales bacterium]
MPPALVASLLVGAGGFLGAIARYLTTNAIGTSASGIPWATFVINVSGSLLLGALGTAATRGLIGAPEPVRLALGVGFLGAFTTFSTFSVETNHLIQTDDWPMAMLYAAGSVVAGLAAVRAGAAIGAAL